MDLALASRFALHEVHRGAKKPNRRQALEKNEVGCTAHQVVDEFSESFHSSSVFLCFLDHDGHQGHRGAVPVLIRQNFMDRDANQETAVPKRLTAPASFF